MKNPKPAGRPKGGPMRPLVHRHPEFDWNGGFGEGDDYRTLADRWRVENIEQDESFRSRVLHAAGLME